MSNASVSLIIGMLMIFSACAGIDKKPPVSSASDVTQWRGPMVPVNPDLVNYQTGILEEFIDVDLITLKMHVEETLNEHKFLKNSLITTEDMIVMRTKFKNITEMIRNFKDHIVKLSFLIEIKETSQHIDGVSLKWQYGLCHAPFKSKHWIYDEIPVHVRDQVEEFLETLKMRFN
ncbi:MAG: hypothetical protein GWN00_16550 [Aliifodinibius sp.]|nr:hypothetical protein [Fodinibius sp.]NIV12651.1 hypothetical protein [Fodinibius sp.]NIY26355.1 hypothetical protein [Fodinibius sp.]